MHWSSGSNLRSTAKERAGRRCVAASACERPSAARSTDESTLEPTSNVAATGLSARPHTPSKVP
eukprot:6191580-Pleurochrysis_carterae.AAC.2